MAISSVGKVNFMFKQYKDEWRQKILEGSGAL